MTRSTESKPRSWLQIYDVGESCVTVTVTGSCASSRAVELWAAVEEALEIAAGRLVVLDLSSVTTFDVDCIQELRHIILASSRRRLDLCTVLRPDSPLAQYAVWSGVARRLPVFPTRAAALLAA